MALFSPIFLLLVVLWIDSQLRNPATDFPDLQTDAARRRAVRLRIVVAAVELVSNAVQVVGNAIAIATGELTKTHSDLSLGITQRQWAAQVVDGRSEEHT